MPPNIILKDGREIFIIENFNEARMIEKLFKPLHPRKGEWKYNIIRKVGRFLLT